MLLIQIFLILFFLFALSRVILRYKKGDLTVVGLAFWTIFWILAGVVVVIPNSSAYFAKIVGIGRGADLVVYLSIALLFFLVFKISVRQERISKEITKVVRKETLNDR